MKNHYFEADHIDDLYKQIIKRILQHPDFTPSPRGMEIREIIAPKIVLTNPKNSLITIPERKLSHPFAIIEKFEYLNGKHDPDRLIAYNKQFASYGNRYERFDGAYADRFNYWFEHIYKLLLTDPDTRQAVMTVYGQQDRHESKDIPCTLNHQYFIRDGKLHAVAEMRSNDMLWGFPYDVNGFVFLQEVMASWLGIPMGTYTHIAGSMHIYMDNSDRLQQLVDSAKSTESDGKQNPVFNLSYEETKQWVPVFLAAEQALRDGDFSTAAHLKAVLPEVLVEYLTRLEGKWLK